MRSRWVRLLAWLRREAYVRQVVEECTKNGYLEGHAVGYAQGQRAAYDIGLAQGELVGRNKLAAEIEFEHGVGGGEYAMTRLELATLKLKQLH